MKRCINTHGNGFSLVELVVVLSLISVVSTIGATGFFRMTDYWNDLQANMRLNKNISLAYEAMADDFENILSAKTCGIGLRGERVDSMDNVQFWRISFEDDKVTLPVEVFNPVLQTRDRLSVTYAIEREQQTPRLVRTAVALGEKDGKGSKVVIADNIVGIRIHYSDGKEWHDEWSAKEMPRLVRVSLSAIDGARTDRNVARVTCFPIRVR